MTDRPIFFSGAMVRALLAGRKTQTRRLDTSPLRVCAAGDRLWVREAWRTGLAYEDLKPSEMGGEEQILFEADGATDRWTRGSSEPGRLRPSMHMQRWASRLTLIVEDRRTEFLQTICEADAIAEGIEPQDGGWKSYETYPDGTPHPHASVANRSPITSYRELWQSLHRKEGQRWEDYPRVVMLTFRVVMGNIDQVAA